MGLAAYLVVPHLGLMRGELVGGAACSGGMFDCHAVTGSPWGRFLGVPLAFWGFFGYVLVFGLALQALASPDSGELLPALFTLALVFIVIDVVLVSIMAVAIRLFCGLCLASVATNVGLLAVTWPAAGGLAAVGRLGASLGVLVPSRQRPAAGLFWGIVLVGAVGVSGVHAATTYISLGTLGSLQPKIREFVAHQQRVQVGTSGDPRLGPATAALELVEFSDFLCPICQRASKLNKVILAGHRSEAALVFKHFPLDTACNPAVTRMVHPGACEVAAASECAHQQGKFWPFHDLVFAETPPYPVARIDADAQAAGLEMTQFRACLASGEGMEAVRRDTAAAGPLNVHSTPTYVLNGVLMPGILTPATFETLAEELRRPRRP